MSLKSLKVPISRKGLPQISASTDMPKVLCLVNDFQKPFFKNLSCMQKAQPCSWSWQETQTSVGMHKTKNISGGHSTLKIMRRNVNLNGTMKVSGTGNKNPCGKGVNLVIKGPSLPRQS